MLYAISIDDEPIAIVLGESRALSIAKFLSRNNRKVSVKDEDGNLIYFCA